MARLVRTRRMRGLFLLLGAVGALVALRQNRLAENTRLYGPS